LKYLALCAFLFVIFYFLFVICYLLFIICYFLFFICGIGNSPHNEKIFYNTLCELFENEYVNIAFGYKSFLKNYNGYKKYPDVFNDLLFEGKIFDCL